ncbi:hypothetical protein HDV05_006835 [Chytridiales sp. JEL 0842]|nr:hypothetical protein HDV05_006835 [Chytridiales sp. JEL 0842]
MITSPSSASAATKTPLKVTLTLPIACGICFSRVQAPTLCPNRHVFCDNCISEWLKRRSECPTCRIPITLEAPCLPIIGGKVDTPDQNGTSRKEESAIRSTKRRFRAELILKEYDEHIEELENTINGLQKKCDALEKTLEQLKPPTVIPAMETPSNLPKSHLIKSPGHTVKFNLSDPENNPFVVDRGVRHSNNGEPRPLKRHRSDAEADHHINNNDEENGMHIHSTPPTSSESSPKLPPILIPASGSQVPMTPSTSALSKLAVELQNLQTYHRSKKAENSYLKEQLRERSVENEQLRANLAKAMREIEKLKNNTKASVHASPSKTCTAALKLQVTELMRENAELHAALLKSDEYIEQLKKQLENVQAA